MRAGVRDLAHDLLTIEATGDYAGAKKMLDTLSVLRPDVARTIAGLTTTPVDIEPLFVTANSLDESGGRLGPRPLANNLAILVVKPRLRVQQQVNPARHPLCLQVRAAGEQGEAATYGRLPRCVDHSEKSIAFRALSTSFTTCQEIGAMWLYHGHFVVCEWQFSRRAEGRRSLWCHMQTGPERVSGINRCVRGTRPRQELQAAENANRRHK